MLDPMEVRVLEHFGRTEDLRETGYILSDGTLVDFSGRHASGMYAKKGDRFVPKRLSRRIVPKPAATNEDWLQGQRVIDHRQLPADLTHGRGPEDRRPFRIFLLETGALRVFPHQGFEVMKMPTEEAVHAFVEAWEMAYGGDLVQVDVVIPEGQPEAGAVESKEFPPDVGRILHWLRQVLGESEPRPSMGASSLRYGKGGPKDWSPRGRIPGTPISKDFVTGYLEAALFTAVNQTTGEPLDRRYRLEDFTEKAVREAIRECNLFILQNKPLFEDPLVASLSTDQENGRDLWYVRNSHGVGYIGRGYGEAGRKLQEAARKLRDVLVEVNRDNELQFYTV
jgi:hypothetical protein